MLKSSLLQNIFTCVSAIIIIIALSASCAEPSAPKGGPKDIRAPKISTKKYSTPNESTNFKDNQVILTFDEWVKLQAAYSQVIISPPLEEKPEVKIRNKSVVVKWKEELKDSTTYIINFGEAVRDITEGNIAKNLKMVFSTGPFLDSLECQGQVVDAKSRDPKADVLVMLYRNLEDSIPLTQKPYYFAKTDEQGGFKITHIKEGTYRVFALEDQNNDYKYNLANEEIAFLDSSFQINASTQPILRLTMFKEREKTIVLSKKLAHYGCLKIKFNNLLQTKSSIDFLNAPKEIETYIEQGEDSLTLWFDGEFSQDEKWSFVVSNKEEDLNDTIQVSSETKEDFEEYKTSLRWFVKREASENERGNNTVYVPQPLQDTSTIEQSPFTAIKLHFIRPVSVWDQSKVFFFQDTVVEVKNAEVQEVVDSVSGEMIFDTTYSTIKVDTFLPIKKTLIQQENKGSTVLSFSPNWKENKRYKIMLLPDAVTDFFGDNNNDTLSRVYRLSSKENYGTITATITEADSTEQYLIQLVDSKGKIKEEKVVQDSSQIQLEYPNIPTDTYTIRVVHDSFVNGRWDVGSYKEKRQAEKTTTSKPIALKPGWENFMELSLKSISLEN